MSGNPQKSPKLWDILFWQFWTSEKGKCCGIFLQNFREKNPVLLPRIWELGEPQPGGLSPPLTLCGSTVSLPPGSWPGAGSLRIYKLVATWCGRRSQQPLWIQRSMIRKQITGLALSVSSTQNRPGSQGLSQKLFRVSSECEHRRGRKMAGMWEGLRNDPDRRS